MESIVTIKGKVVYPITLDPGVWIFDERKDSLEHFFHPNKLRINELEEYTKEVSSHWDREITEGAKLPESQTPEKAKTYKKEKLITGSFGIPLKPFLLNASPLEDAHQLIVLTSDGEIELDLGTAYDVILGFSKDGKPLKEDGPIHIYFGDGTNKEHPIKNVRGFIVK
jgi:hypothetical protein